MITYIRVDIYIYISRSLQHIVLAKRKSVKRKGEDHHDSCIRVEDKSKRQALRRGKQRLSCAFMVGIIKPQCKECHFILPLVIKTFIMQSVTFISSISQVRIKLILFTLIDHTYLERAIFISCTDDNLLEVSYSIHRQVWWTLMAKTGLRDIWKHKQYLYLVQRIWLA